MHREGYVPNVVTYVSILNACASEGSLAWVKDIHTYILVAGVKLNLCVASAHIYMYANSGIDDT